MVGCRLTAASALAKISNAAHQIPNPDAERYPATAHRRERAADAAARYEVAIGRLNDENCWLWSFDYHPARALTAEERDAMETGKGIHVLPRTVPLQEAAAISRYGREFTRLAVKRPR